MLNLDFFSQENRYDDQLHVHSFNNILIIDLNEYNTSYNRHPLLSNKANRLEKMLIEFNAISLSQKINECLSFSNFVSTQKIFFMKNEIAYKYRRPLFISISNRFAFKKLNSTMFRPPLNRYIRPVAINSYTSIIQRANETKKTENKKSSLFRSATIKDYLANTSLHGLNFIGSSRITLFER